MRQAAQRLLRLAAMMTWLSGAAPAYYHFVHYAARTAPFVAIPEKFDLGAFPDRAVPYFISEEGPAQLAPGDSLAGVISQLRLAARTWSEVPGSELRLVFGGLASRETPRTTPAIDILFEELPPGVLAMGGPVARAEVTQGANGSFVPILRSAVLLKRDLSDRPSFTDGFFLTTLHELGHALGLQHTAASSLMSTDVTRAVTRARPLAADDMTGLALLYPAQGFGSETGSIAGRVFLTTGEGAALASVVALNPSGQAVSALTHPDGTYRIEGLAPGQYYVYVHPLPPSELGPYGIVLPVDASGAAIPAGDPFETLFFPGTKNPEMAGTIAVSAGAAVEGVNFRVQRRTPLQLYGVTTYSFPGMVAVKPAFVNVNGPVSRWFLLAVSEGMALTSGGAPAPGLRVSVLSGGAAVGELRAYAGDPRYLQVGLQFNPLAGIGPRHLVFSYNNDLHVLPSGLNVVNRQPPAITGVTADFDAAGNRVAVVSGTNLSADTRILFDGAPAAVRSVEEGRLVVVPPPAAGGHVANVMALAGDGQTSAFLQGRSLPTYAYDPADPPFVSLSANALPAGVESMIEVTGLNTRFSEDTRLGFGSGDVSVRRIWVLSPTRLLANVAVAPSAPGATTTLSVITGLQVFTQPFAFQIQPADARLPIVRSPLVNAATGRSSVYPGAVAVLSGANFSTAPGAVTVTLNEVSVPVQSVSSNQVVFQIPPGFPVGPAVLRLQSAGERSFPLAVAIDAPPPLVTGLINASAGNTGRAARAGDLITLTVSGLAEGGATPSAGTVKITVGGVEHQALSVIAAPQPGVYLVVFMLGAGVPAGPQVPLTVSLGERTSLPYLLPVGG
jgi:uncharacterized protein (TIGR03437 family)